LFHDQILISTYIFTDNYAEGAC